MIWQYNRSLTLTLLDDNNDTPSSYTAWPNFVFWYVKSTTVFSSWLELVRNKTKDNLYTSDEVRYVSPSLYIRHPLYIKNQCHFVFEVGMVYSDIAKNIFN